MTRNVCLIRGVNVGGRNKLAMSDVRALFEERGFDDVVTFIQSGNVVFSSSRRPDPDALAASIDDAFGLDVAVVVRTAAELQGILASNPFDDLEKTHVAFLAKRPSFEQRNALDPGAFAPEAFALNGTEIYLFLPHGMARTKLPSYLERQLKIPTTIRNWRTVTKLGELTAG